MLCCSAPLKQWKCSFEETLQSRCVPDGLQAIAAVFAESQLFHEIHAYVTAQHNMSAAKSSGVVKETCDKPDTEQLPLCDSNRDTDVSCVCAVTNTEPTTTQHYTQLLTANVQLTTADDLSKCVTDSAADDDKSVTDSAALNDDVSVMNQTMTEVLNQGMSESQCRKTRNKSSASKIKQVCNSREQRKSRRASSDKKVDKTSETGNTTSAGITHCSCCFSVICSQFVTVELWLLGCLFRGFILCES